MRSISGIAITALTAGVLCGCQTTSSDLVGTWESTRADDDLERVDFDFASVTFAPDGTYTAEMIYGGETLAETGTWKRTNGTLIVGSEEGTRNYGMRFREDGGLVFSDDRYGEVVMSRYRP